MSGIKSFNDANARVWYLDNRIHRVDGPAVIEADGTKEWWANGNQYKFQDWIAVLIKQNLITYRQSIELRLRY